MRERRTGHVFFITSMGGLRAFAGLSLYHGSKYAVEGIADSLRPEVAPFGIRVTSVEPGSFRTDWAGRSMHRVERSIPDYDEVFGPIRETAWPSAATSSAIPPGPGGHCSRASTPRPPGHLLLGSDAVRLVTQARTAVDEEFAHWHELSVSTDLPDGKVIA